MVEPCEALLAIRFHVLAACWVNLIFLPILLSIHTVNMKRRRYRKTEHKACFMGADDRETHTDECEKRNATSRADSPSHCIAETQARSKLTAPARRQSWTVSYSAPLLAVSIILCEFPRAACLLSLISLIVCKSSKGRGTRMVRAAERYLLYFSFFPAIKNLNTYNSLKQ